MADQHQLKQMHDQLQRDFTKRNSRYADSVVYLYQTDFTNGSYQITKPGVYKLAESIVFNPNSLEEAQTNGLPGSAPNPSATPWDTGSPTPAQFGDYSPAAFGIGFFAAIVITTNDVTLDLNGFTLSQSLEHTIQQKFYANIELANQPFVPTEGPHNFGNRLSSAKNVAIVNGNMGLSAHHQIHGNNNTNVLIKGISFSNHELAAVSLNGAENVVVKQCRVMNNRHDLLLRAIYSSTRFQRDYLNALAAAYDGGDASVTIDIAGVTKTATEIRDELRTYTNTAFDGIVNEQSWWNDTATGVTNSYGESVDPRDPYKLFNNEFWVIDGNSYGFLFNARGNAVGGFPEHPSSYSTNIYLEDLMVQNHKGTVIEAPTFKQDHTVTIDNMPLHQTDATGAILQTQNDYNGELQTIDANDYYVGNPVANAQLLIAKHKDHASLAHLDTKRSLRITADTLAWAASGSTTYASHNLEYMCNGDAMFHVNKGVIIYRLDAVKNAWMTNCRVLNVENQGSLGTPICGNYEKSHPEQTLTGYGGCSIRGINLASSHDVTIFNCNIDGCTSVNGEAFGIDIQQNCRNIKIRHCDIDNIHAGTNSMYSFADFDNNPTRMPNAYGIHVGPDVRNVDLTQCQIESNLTARGTVVKYACEERTLNTN